MSAINKNETPELHDFAVEFRKYKTELTKKFMDRKKWEPEDVSKISAFIPGTISKIFVELGSKVEEGDKLMEFEAMKMKNTVYAEYNGVIEAINASEGDQIRKGQVVFELDLD